MRLFQSHPSRVIYRYASVPDSSIESRPLSFQFADIGIPPFPIHRSRQSRLSIQSHPLRAVHRESSIPESSIESHLSRCVYWESSIESRPSRSVSLSGWSSWPGQGNSRTPRSRAMEPFRQAIGLRTGRWGESSTFSEAM